jgi:hypothetical protein
MHRTYLGIHRAAGVTDIVRKNRFLTWLALGVVVVAATVGIALLINRAPSPEPPPKAQGATAAQNAEATTTTITLKVTPAAPVDPITTETLTATITPPTAAGVVQFNDGSTTLDDPVVLTEGSASTITTLSGGEHSLTADFTPTDASAFSESTSNTVDYPVNTVPTTGATPTTITLVVTLVPPPPPVSCSSTTTAPPSTPP